MKGQQLSPSQLLKLQKETGQSYWDLIGRPLTKKEEGPKQYTLADIEDEVNQYALDHFSEGKDNTQAYINDYDDVLGLDSQKDQKVINMYDSVIVNGQRQTPTPNNPIVGYDGGKDIPEYGHGKSKSRVYSEEQLRKSLMNYGVTDPYMVAGIMGNAKIESGYNPDSVSKSGTYKGLWQLQPGYVQYVTDNYGNYDPESQIRFIADIVKGTLPETKSTTGKWLSTGVSKKLRQIKNTRPEQAAYNFQKYFEGAMGQNNSSRMNAARDVYDSYLFDKNKLTVDKIISQSQAVPVDVTRVQKPLVTYNPNTPTTYSNPAYAQKPVENIPTDIQRPKSILPNIIDTYNNLQNDQQPLIIQPKRSFIQPQWQNGKDSQQVDMSKVGMGAEKKPNYFIDNTMNPLPEVTITGDALKNNNRIYSTAFDSNIPKSSDDHLFGMNNEEAAIAGFIPIIGTLDDAFQMYKNPSLFNAGWLTASLATDLIGGNLIKGIVKTNKALKAAKIAEVASKQTAYQTSKGIERLTKLKELNQAKKELYNVTKIEKQQKIVKPFDTAAFYTLDSQLQDMQNAYNGYPDYNMNKFLLDNNIKFKNK